MIIEKPELVEALADNLANAVVLYFKAHGHHWNVTGRDFAEFHEFFEEIYEDIHAQLDPIAENMRKMGANAPYQLQDFMNMSQMQDEDVANDPMLMVKDLYVANNIMIASINNAFKIANDLDEQGIADYLAGRDDMHKKWRWQLQAFLAPTMSSPLGKDSAVQPLEADDSDVSVVEQLMNDKDGCPLCGSSGCVCPGCEGGMCLCDENCPCPQCHVRMMLDSDLYNEDEADNDAYEVFYAQQQDALAAAGIIVQEEQDLADALIEITQKHGKFDSDDSGVWAGYESAAENENKEIGVKCANCILYVGGTECKILDHEVEPEGYCRFALIPDGVVTAAASRKAPKKDRIYGSKKNPKGSAAGGKKIVFSQKIENSLRNKVEEHNKNAKAGRKATLPMLKAVYRRGSGAFSSSHRPGKTRDQWAMARVNAFLKLLRSGSPANPNYKQDNDLLPKAHPKSSKAEASLIQHELLQVALKSADEYGSPEHAIFSMAEYSGLGYDVIPALRGAWLRGVRDGDVPFNRAYELATKLYGSKDADLLPKKRKKVSE
jgi:starvation-inducible DNA-binding protein